MAGPHRLGIPTIGSVRGLDRCAEKRADKDWVAAARADPASRFLLLVDLKISVAAGEGGATELVWRSADEIARLGASLDDAILLGRDGAGQARFGVALRSSDVARAEGGPDGIGALAELRGLAVRGALGPHDLAVVGEARAVAAWHDGHRCCGRCGARMKTRDAGWRRQCWACGHSAFPRADPAVIVLVTHGDRCLLAHHRRFQEPRYTVLAGFVEPGEDIEDAVRREIREESGVEVGEVAYLGSQPWPFPHSLMLACRGEALTDGFRLDKAELTHAVWADRAEAAAILDGTHPQGWIGPGPFSIAYMLIRHFADGGG